MKPNTGTHRAAVLLSCFTCQNRDKDEWCALSLDDMTLLDKAKSTLEFQPGEVVHAQGGQCRGIYDIESGTVAIRRTDADGNSILVRLAHSGQTLGYRDYFGGSEYTSSAEALRPVRVCHIESGAIGELMQHDPALGLRFLERIASDLERAEGSLLQRPTLPIRTRLAHLLLTLKFRYGTVDEEGTIVIKLPMQRQDMAALLGTRPETLARAFQAMRQTESWNPPVAARSLPIWTDSSTRLRPFLLEWPAPPIAAPSRLRVNPPIPFPSLPGAAARRAVGSLPDSPHGRRQAICQPANCNLTQAVV